MSADKLYARSAVLDGFVTTANKFEIDAIELLNTHHIPISSLRSPNKKIPTSFLIRLLEEAAEKSGTPDFALHMAQARNASTLGTIEIIMREQINLRDALKSLATYLWAQGEGVSVDIDEVDNTCTLSVRIAAELPSPNIQTLDLCIGSLVRIISRLLGTAWRPDMVVFEHPKPNGKTLHSRYFGQEPVYGFDRNALVFNGDELDLPLPTANPDSAKQVEAHFSSIIGPSGGTFRDAVSSHIQSLMPQGACRIDHVADLMGVTRRTVHRRLAEENITFSQLVHQNRVTLADIYTNSTAKKRSKTEIAQLLGFANLSSFSRWTKSRNQG